MFEKVFVTVGTTSFEPLVKLVVSSKAVAQFTNWGVKKVRIQGGKSSIKENGSIWTENGIEFDFFDYKTSVLDDMLWADLIICHAGAGTTIEALDMGKTLLVVPNEALMNNHQIQLAKKLREESYAFMATVNTFFDEMEIVDPSKVIPFPPPNTEKLVQRMNEVFEQYERKD